MQPLGKVEAPDKVLLDFERVQARSDEKTSLHQQIEARLKVLSASRGEEMYTLGKLRHQKKSFSPQSEFRQDETEKSGVLAISRMGKEGWRRTLSP